MTERDFKVIALDFDGTLFVTDYPKILWPIEPMILWARERRKKGDRLILWTCREGPELEAAVEICRAYGLEFDAVNDNIPELKEMWGNNPRKVSADWYIDDKNVIMVQKAYGMDGCGYSLVMGGGRLEEIGECRIKVIL